MRELLLEIGGCQLVNDDGMYIVLDENGVEADRTTIKDDALGTLTMLASNDLRDYYNHLYTTIRRAYYKVPQSVFLITDSLRDTLHTHYRNTNTVFADIMGQLLYYRKSTIAASLSQKVLPSSTYKPYIEYAFKETVDYPRFFVKDIDALGDCLCHYAMLIDDATGKIGTAESVFTSVGDVFLDRYIIGLFKEENYRHRVTRGRPVALTPFSQIATDYVVNADAALADSGVNYLVRLKLFGLQAVLSEDTAKTILRNKFHYTQLEDEVNETLSVLDPLIRSGLSSNKYIACCQHLCRLLLYK